MDQICPNLHPLTFHPLYCWVGLNNDAFHHRVLETTPSSIFRAHCHNDIKPPKTCWSPNKRNDQRKSERLYNRICAREHSRSYFKTQTNQSITHPLLTYRNWIKIICDLDKCARLKLLIKNIFIIIDQFDSACSNMIVRPHNEVSKGFQYLVHWKLLSFFHTFLFSEGCEKRTTSKKWHYMLGTLCYCSKYLNVYNGL